MVMQDRNNYLNPLLIGSIKRKTKRRNMRFLLLEDSILGKVIQVMSQKEFYNNWLWIAHRLIT